MGDFKTLLFKEETDEGTTADAYADITFDVRTKKAITIRLQNTGDTNGLTYRVDSYANIDGTIDKEEVSAANVAAAGIVEIVLPKTAEFPKKLARIVLQVKSQGAGNPTTYKYESISGRY